MTVTVGNKPTKNNKIPTNETSSVTISCDLPVTMEIKPAIPLPLDCLLTPSTTSDPLVSVSVDPPVSVSVYPSVNVSVDSVNVSVDPLVGVSVDQ